MASKKNSSASKSQSSTKPTAQTQSNKNPSSSSSNNNSNKPSATHYSVVRDGWGGSRANFQASYGLDMSPDGIEEGNAILDAFIEQDARAQGGRE